jgi:hypothetical protein
LFCFRTDVWNNIVTEPLGMMRHKSNIQSNKIALPE